MNVISTPTRTLLALSAIKGVGPAALKRIANVPMFWECSLQEWSAAAPLLAKALQSGADDVWRVAQQWADGQVAAAEKHLARILSAVDDDYPPLLAATKDDPFLLFVKGALATDAQKSVAIIGTREPTQHGVMIAQRITQFFVEHRWSVVSGLALGCDSIAHQAALDAGGHTVAVMAHGLQMVAPSRHKKLAQDILDAGGALVSEYPFGRDAMGSQFVKRDRTQAGMAQGVVMIQSDLRGGSLHASRASLDYQRWLAVPYPTDKDRENEEPKVQANLLIADGTDPQRADLLRCPVSALRFVQVVRGRSDYLKLIGQQAPIADASTQTSIAEASESRSLHADASSDLAVGSLQPDEIVQPSNVAEDMVASPADETSVSEDISLEVQELPDPVSEVAVAIDPSSEALAPFTPGSKSVTTYRLAVDTEDLASLKNAKVQFASAEPEVASANVFDVDVVLTLLRLEHLQLRLDDLRKARPKRPADDHRVRRFQFQVEDVLTHMKRATDQLVQLDAAGDQRHVRSILVKHGTPNGQPELPLMSEAAKPWDAPLVEVLDSLVGSLPRSVSFHGQKVRGDGPEEETRVDVHLRDLLFSFNDLVRTVLPQGSFALKTTIPERVGK